MAINPELITTIRVDQLPDGVLGLDSLIPHTVGTELKRSTIQELVDLVATSIGTGSGVGFLPISVTDGQQLPNVPADPSFFLAGAGTYLNINGFPNIICTEELNAIMSLNDHWELAVQIPINATGGGGVPEAPIDGQIYGRKDADWEVVTAGGSSIWGAIIGTLSDQTDLQTVLNAKTEKLITTNRRTASYTLVLTDANKLVEMNVATANNLTVPPNASVAFPVGTRVDVTQYGVGITTINLGAGVTIRSTNNWYRMNAQYAGASLVKIATNEWYLFGNLNA